MWRHLDGGFQDTAEHSLQFSYLCFYISLSVASFSFTSQKNHSSMFYRITVQRKFTGQHLQWRPLFIKLKLVALQLCDIKVPSKHFPIKFVKIFRTVFYGALPGYCSCTIMLYFGKNFYLNSKIYYQIKSLEGFQDCFQILNSLSPL